MLARIVTKCECQHIVVRFLVLFCLQALFQRFTYALRWTSRSPHVVAIKAENWGDDITLKCGSTASSGDRKIDWTRSDNTPLTGKEYLKRDDTLLISCSKFGDQNINCKEVLEDVYVCKVTELSTKKMLNYGITLTYEWFQKKPRITTIDPEPHSLSVHWDRVDGCDGYRLKCSLIEGTQQNPPAVRIYAKLAVSGKCTNLVPGTAYSIGVYTTYKQSFSETVNKTFLTVPDKPNIRPGESTLTSVSFTWDEPQNGRWTHYRITGANNVDKEVGRQEPRLFKASNLEPGKQYSYTLYAVREFETLKSLSDNSNKYEGRTLLDTAKNVTVVYTFEDRIKVSVVRPQGKYQKLALYCTNKNNPNNQVYSSLGRSRSTATCLGLQPGNFYQLHLRTTASGFSAVNTQVIQAMTILGKVADVGVKKATEHDISVNWKHAQGKHDKYVLHCKTDTRDGYSIRVETHHETGICNGCLAGAHYHVSVETVQAGFPSVSTSPLTVVTVPLPPETPELFLSPHVVEARWDPPARGALTSYVIKYPADVLSHSENPLKQHWMEERVVRFRSPGFGVKFDLEIFSASQYYGTEEKRSEGVIASGKVGLHRVSVTIDETTTTTIKLSWQNKKGNRDNYRVECRQPGNGFQKMVLATTTTALCRDLLPGTRYNVTVTTQLASFESVPSRSVYTITNPVPPETLSTTTTTEKANVWWPARPKGSFSHYVATYSVVGWDGVLSGNRTLVVGKDELSFNIAGLKSGTTYHVAVQTVVAEGLLKSKPVWKRLKTALKKVPIQVDNVTSTAVFVSWLQQEGNRDGYVVKCWDSNSFVVSNFSAAATAGQCIGLTPVHRYSVTVSTVLTGFKTVTSELHEAVTEPSQPADLSVIPSTTETIDIRWNAENDFYSYYVVNVTQVDGEDSKHIHSITVRKGEETSLNVTNLTPGKTYRVTVTSVGSEGSGTIRSKPVSVEVAMRPLPPASLNISSTTTDLDVKWASPKSGSFSHYVVDYTPIDGRVPVVTTSKVVEKNERTALSITGLTPGSTYNVSVTVVSSKIPGAVTSVPLSATVTTKSLPPSDVKVITTDGKITGVKWTAPTSGGFSHHLVKYTPINAEELQKTIFVEKGKETSLNLTDLEPGSSYRVSIESVAGTRGSTAHSEQKSVNITIKPFPPSALNATATEDKIDVTWIKPSAGSFSHFLVKYKAISEKGSQKTIVVDKPNKTSCTLKDLNPGSTYEVSVETVAGSAGAPTANSELVSVNITTKPSSPFGLKATASEDKINVTWTAPSSGHFTHYRVKYAAIGQRGLQKTLVVDKVDKTSLTLKGVKPGLTYRVSVETVAGLAGVGTASSELVSVNVTTTHVEIWSDWGAWVTCSKTCGEGIKRRVRECNKGPEKCSEKTEERPCVLQKFCPVSGNWSSWGSWGSCSVTCGDGKGVMKRKRTCDNSPPSHGGNGCPTADQAENIRECLPTISKCPGDTDEELSKTSKQTGSIDLIPILVPIFVILLLLAIGIIVWAVVKKNRKHVLEDLAPEEEQDATEGVDEQPPTGELPDTLQLPPDGHELPKADGPPDVEALPHSDDIAGKFPPTSLENAEDEVKSFYYDASPEVTI